MDWSYSARVLDGLEWLRVVGYVVAAATAVRAGRREQRRVRIDASPWPTFWFLTAGVLLMMAIGLSADLGGWIAELGRRIAHSEGWYAERRKPQAIAVGSIGVIWFVVVVASLWRVPERRRRYLPTTLTIFTMLCFAGIRLISLHQVDAFYHHQVLGAQIGTIVELGLLVFTIAVTMWQPEPMPSSDPQARTAVVDAT
jgi:hypothetical protein